MFNNVKSFLILFILCCALTKVNAQHISDNANTFALNTYQDSLIKMSEATFNTSTNIDRFAKNAIFIKTLVNALKIKYSFNYGFDSLHRVSVVKSPDNSFRIFSWFVPKDDGTYRFFGSIQMSTANGELQLFPLIDDTDNFKDTNEITGNKKWYGCRYYEIVPVSNGEQQTYYVLLGWKGNNSKTTKKVMDILSFNQGEPVFGKNVFEGLKNTSLKNRIVFEYNKLNSMTLKLDKKAGMIVFDHLVPFNPNMTGNFEYYASDSSFDAYRVVNGKLKLIENVDLKNDL